MNRFADNAEDLVILTPEEAKRADSWNLASEKERLLKQGFSPLDLQDLAAFHKAHPDVALNVAV